MKLDSTGALQWQRCLGGTLEDHLTSIEPTVDGGYIVGGYSRSSDGDVSANNGYYDVWVVKLDGNGNIEWQDNFGGSSWDTPSELKAASPDGYILAGLTTSNNGDVSGHHGQFDMWLVKFSQGPTSLDEDRFGHGFTVRPNPTNDISTLALPPGNAARDLMVIDAIGRSVAEYSLRGDDRSLALDLRDQADGLYAVVITFADGSTATARLVKE